MSNGKPFTIDGIEPAHRFPCSVVVRDWPWFWRVRECGLPGRGWRFVAIGIRVPLCDQHLRRYDDEMR